MSVKYSLSVKNARAGAVATKIDAASQPATLTLYSGTMPSGLGPVTTQVAAVVLTMQKPCYTAITDGIIYLAAMAEQMVANTATVAWARIKDGDGNVIADMDVGNMASSADVKIPQVDLIQGSYIRLTAGQLREG